LIDGGARVTGDLTSAKSDSSQCSSTGPDVYYSFFGRSPITAQVTRLDGGTWTPHLMLKASCAAAYLVCANTPPSPTVTYSTAIPGQYFVQVDSALPGAGAFQLEVTAAPITDGDLCVNAIPVTLGDFEATTVDAESDTSLTCSPWIAGNSDVFFTLDLPDAGAADAGILTAQIISDAGRQMVINIRTGSTCPGAAAGNPACGSHSASPIPTARVPALPGPYVIVVGDRAQKGPFSLHLTVQ